MNVILIGYRGCGKTSVGRKLADQLWKTFVDVDRETRRRFDDRSIANIWREQGEPAWREQEARVTAQLLGRAEQVIALGGGTLTIPAARQAVEQAREAQRIYLSCEAEELHRRIQADGATAADRPHLTDLAGGAAEIREVLAQRDPEYRAVADAVFDVTHPGVDETVRYLIQRFL